MLSTDIDIVVKPGTDIESYIKRASEIFPFISYEEQVRVGKNNIEKRHFKFTYLSPINKRNIYILLDVSIPSVECVLGDKLTAFAPHTIGVRLNDNKDMEIANQF